MIYYAAGLALYRSQRLIAAIAHPRAPAPVSERSLQGTRAQPALKGLPYREGETQGLPKARRVHNGARIGFLF